MDPRRLSAEAELEPGLLPPAALNLLKWLATTDRAADRIGFIVAGDLARCVATIDRDGSRDGTADRITDLVWASITEEVLGVRGRVEGWASGSQPPGSAPAA